MDGYPSAPYMTPLTARAYEKVSDLPSLNWPVAAAHLGAPVRQHGGSWPVVLLLFGKQDLDPFEAATWADFWTKQRGPELWRNLKGSMHVPSQTSPLVPQVGTNGKLPLVPSGQ